MKYLRSAVSWALRALITAYRYGLAPVLGAHCRYAPSCSAYAQEAIGAHGPWRGSWLALRRILRCHPWGGAGYDPVPTAGSGNYEHRPARSPRAAKLGKG